MEGYFDDFSVMRMGKNVVKWTFCRTHYRTRKWGFRRENIRYALPGFRMFALKCKPRPPYGIKRYYNSTVLWYVFIWSVVWSAIADLLFLIQTVIFVFVAQTIVFIPKTKNGSTMSVHRIHSKISKVSPNPKNHPIFTIKVVTRSKITPKNIPKVGTTYQISNIIPS